MYLHTSMDGDSRGNIDRLSAVTSAADLASHSRNLVGSRIILCRTCTLLTYRKDINQFETLKVTNSKLIHTMILYLYI